MCFFYLFMLCNRSNGEKTNPLPIEDIIKSNPLVSHCTVIGANEICTAALIQLDVEAVKQLCLDDIYESGKKSTHTYLFILYTF